MAKSNLVCGIGRRGKEAATLVVTGATVLRLSESESM
jgi:hypothetical protein